MKSDIRRFGAVIAALGMMIGFSNRADAASLNIDFGAVRGTPSASFGAASGQVGVWNTISISQLGSTSNLLDIAGANSGVSLALTASSLGNAQSSDPLMSDDFYSTPGAGWSVTLTGVAAGVYDIYFYAPANPIGTRDFTVNGLAVARLAGGGVQFLEGTTYAVVRGLAITDGTILVQSANTIGFAGLSGMQLVGGAAAVPEPTSFALCGLGFLGAACLGWRRRYASAPGSART